jgi:hypothetical protein
MCRNEFEKLRRGDATVPRRMEQIPEVNSNALAWLPAGLAALSVKGGRAAGLVRRGAGASL